MAEAARRPLRTRYVTWYDQVRHEIGCAIINWVDYKLRVQYHLLTPEFERPERAVLEMATDIFPRGSHGYRIHVLCRHCGIYVPRLFFRACHFLCQTCQGLNYRSTFLSSQQRWQEEYDGLQYEVAEGRPPGMRELEFARKRRRMADLYPKLDGSRRRPGPQFDRLVFAVWRDTAPET